MEVLQTSFISNIRSIPDTVIFRAGSLAKILACVEVVRVTGIMPPPREHIELNLLSNAKMRENDPNVPGLSLVIIYNGNLDVLGYLVFFDLVEWTIPVLDMHRSCASLEGIAIL